MEQFNTTIGQTETIGFNRYSFLKKMDQSSLTDDERKLIAEYESKNQVTEEQLAYKKKYVERITVEPEMIEYKFDKQNLWTKFLSEFRDLSGKEFVQNTETLENIKPLFFYFLQDSSFFDCKNLSRLSVPSFEKGLLIIGDFGNGKTSTMLSFEKVFSGIKGYGFKSYNANDVVKMFETISVDNFTIDLSRKDFDRKMNLGAKYFDDVKTEKDASNFGKFNLFKDIIETRYNGKYKTYITSNYKPGHPNDLNAALDEFSERYGARVYDRLFEMFNIIEFKGKSFRL